MKTYYTTLQFAILMVSTTMAFAGSVLPAFTNFWYDAYNPDIKMDSCGKIYYSYANQNPSDSVLATKLLGDLSPKPNCKWNTPQKSVDDTLPPAFPTSASDYAIIQKNGGLQSEHWQVDCISPEGHVEDTRSAIVYPAYDCPLGSRIDYDSQTNTSICSTTPSVCEADVVGRDLDSFGLGMLGHVGLASPTNLDPYYVGNYVVEVLNISPVINVNTLQSFENPGSGSYWSEVYGLPKLSFVDGNQAADVIQAGLDQRNYDPEYTITTDWHAGSDQFVSVLDRNTNNFIKQFTMIRALFRCDTFVNYCINKGFGITIPTGLAIIPRSTYNSFLSQRTDVPPQVTSKKLFPNQDVSFETLSDLELEVTGILTSKTLNRIDKLNFLFNLSNKYRNNPRSFGYIIDKIRSQHSIELIPKLVEDYNKEYSEENKLKLLSAISQSAIIYNTDENALKFKNNIIVAQDFITGILQYENNTNFLNSAVGFAPSFLPMNDMNYKLVNKALERLFAQTADDKQNLYFKEISLAFANNYTKAQFLPALLEVGRSETESNYFNNALFAFIKDTPRIVLKDAQSSLLSYFRKSEYMNLYPENYLRSYTFNIKKSMSINKISSANNFALDLDLLYENNSALYKAILIRYLTNEEIKKIPVKLKNALKIALLTNFTKQGARERKIIALAVSKLQY